MTASPGVLHDSRAQHVADRLHARGRRELPALIWYFLCRAAPMWLRGGSFTEPSADDMAFLGDKLMPLGRGKCELCYLLCRSIGARRAVEIGTSFGVSTIYLAAAIRDGGGETVVGSEIHPGKVAIARENLLAAGLEGYVQIREGDALQTLKEPSGTVDFVLIDSWIGLARPAIEMLAPHLRAGAIVLCDNTAQFRREYRDYLGYVHNPANGFRSLEIPYRGGVALSVRLPQRSPAE